MSDVTLSPWVWFALYLVILFYFILFSDKHLCIAVLGNGVWFAFALYRLYWGLVFSASDVTVGTVGLISDSLC